MGFVVFWVDLLVCGYYVLVCGFCVLLVVWFGVCRWLFWFDFVIMVLGWFCCIGCLRLDCFAVV